MKTGEVVPRGLAARDTLRFEAGFPLRKRDGRKRQSLGGGVVLLR